MERNLENIKNMEAEPKKIILEIGCGSRQYFIDHKETIKQNEHYIGVDIPRRHIGDKISFNKPTEEEDKRKQDYPAQESWFELKKFSKNLTENKNLIEGKADFVVANGLKLPFENGKVKTMVFNSVLGAPANYFRGVGFCKNENELNDLWDKTFFQKLLNNLFPDERKKLEDGKRFVIGGLRKGEPMSFDDVFHDVGIKWQKFETAMASYAKSELLSEAYRVLDDDGELIIYDNDYEFKYFGIPESNLNKLFHLISKENDYVRGNTFKLVYKKYTTKLPGSLTRN